MESKMIIGVLASAILAWVAEGNTIAEAD